MTTLTESRAIIEDAKAKREAATHYDMPDDILRPQEIKVLRHLINYQATNDGYSPSRRELCLLMGFSPLTTPYIGALLEALERKGYVSTDRSFRPNRIKVLKVQ